MLQVGCFRNSADTEFRIYIFQFRIFRRLYGIAQNSAELCGIPYCGIRRIPRNSVTFGITKFRLILILQLQASIIGWGKGEMAQFRGTVLRDF